MLEEDLQTPFDKRFVALFTRARLRTTEVALVLNLDRVTISKYKSYGTGACKKITRQRMEPFIDIVHRAIIARDLPFENRDITGRVNRLAALKLILRKHRKK